MSEMIDRVAAALEQAFRDRVAASASTPEKVVTFEQTGVIAPGPEVWQAYARAALDALGPESSLPPLVMWAEVIQTNEGTLVWNCTEDSSRDGYHEEYNVELNPETFAVGTLLRIYEPRSGS